MKREIVSMALTRASLTVGISLSLMGAERVAAQNTHSAAETLQPRSTSILAMPAIFQSSPSLRPEGPVAPSAASEIVAPDRASADRARVVGGTIIGGAMGAVTAGSLGYMAGMGANDEDAWISTSIVFAALLAPVGYTVGSAIGATTAAPGSDGGRVFLASVIGAGLGAGTWSLIGNATENFGAGAVVGFGLHALVTSAAAMRQPAESTQ